jgi:hypothetical protein
MKHRVAWPVALAVILLNFAVNTSFALQSFDDFSTGAQSWIAESGWSVITNSPNVHFYRCDNTGNSTTWKRYSPIDPSSWQFQTDFSFRTLYGSGGTTATASIGLAVASSNPSPSLLVNVNTSSSHQLLVQAEYYDGSWHTVLDSGWQNNTASVYHATVARTAGSDQLQVTVRGTNGFVYSATTTAIPTNVLNVIAMPGFRVFGGVIDAANLQINTPLTYQPHHYQVVATNALNDLVNHFWIGDTLTGQIVNTFNGYTNSLPDARGVLWERAMFYLVLNNLRNVSADTNLAQRLNADWNRTKSVYTSNELASCGQGSKNPAVDDAGWSSLMYLAAYQSTGDAYALDRVKSIVTNAFGRWQDNSGGGMWYNDAHQIKSLYQVAIVLSSLKIYELTGEQYFYDHAFACYSWMETNLLRSDGLYWCDYDSSGPVGQDRFDQIAETNSVVSLGGAWAMGILHSRLYQMTDNDSYRSRAIRTANGIFNKLATAQGVCINDRDAWTQGVFAADWVREVLVLPGIESKHWMVLWTTADSIYKNARTTNGYYGGSWSGPAEGPGSAWWVAGSRPEQIMTSSSSVNMIAAAAILESEYLSVIPPYLQISNQTSSATIRVIGQSNWPYQLQSATNLASWSAVTNLYTDSSSNRFNASFPKTGSQLFYRGNPLLQP